MRMLVIAGLFALIASPAFAQYGLTPYPEKPACGEPRSSYFCHADWDAWRDEVKQLKQENEQICNTYTQPQRRACNRLNSEMRNDAVKN